MHKHQSHQSVPVPAEWVSTAWNKIPETPENYSFNGEVPNGCGGWKGGECEESQFKDLLKQESKLGSS